MLKIAFAYDYTSDNSKYQKKRKKKSILVTYKSENIEPISAILRVNNLDNSSKSIKKVHSSTKNTPTMPIAS